MIALYSPAIPPVAGGVADHTVALARAMEAEGQRALVIAQRGDAGLLQPVTCVVGVPVNEAPRVAHTHGAEWLMVQYVPFLYAKRGVAPALWQLGARCRRSGVRLAVFMHEPFVPFTRLAWLVTGPLQRLQLHLLLRSAERVYAAVPRFCEIAGRYGGDAAKVRIAPVGATIPVSRTSGRAEREHLGIEAHHVAIGVFSPAASGFAHAWIAASAADLAQYGNVRWVLFGHGSERRLTGYPSGASAICVGPQGPERVGAVMRALDVLAAPYVDGLTMRRTGAMLGLASGVATVSSTGPLFDPAMHELAACEPTAQAFSARLRALVTDPSARSALAARTAHYDALASTGRLARQLIGDLAPVA